MTENEFKYWAFLSYSPEDNGGERPAAPAANRLCWGDWLQAALQAFPIPADFSGHPNARGETVPERIEAVFQDQTAQPENAGLSADIRAALEQSRCLIVVCSPRSAGSRHVNEVVRYFKQLGRGNRILSFVIAGEPNASDGTKPGVSPDNECFVPALRHPLLPDGAPDTSRWDRGHIFVDARHGADKREILATDHPHAETDLEIAKIQLIAGLIGVGFNGLWRREQKRRFVGFAEAQQQAREALSQLAAARQQIREAQTQALEKQNLPPDVHQQIEAAQTQAHEAQAQLRETQKRLEELQGKVRDTQSQLAAARQQALATESKFLEAQQQAHEAQKQLELAQQQVGAAQAEKASAHSDPPPAVPDQSHLQELEGKAREAQSQARDTQNQLAEARRQAQEAHAKWLAAQNEIQEFQQQVRTTQQQLEETRQQVREAESKVQEAQAQAREARNQVSEIQAQTHDVRSQIEAAQREVEANQTQARSARRFSRVLALIAVLTLAAAGTAACIAWRQHWIARRAQANVAAAESGKFDLFSGPMDADQIRLALQVIGGTEQATNRWHSLDLLATWISLDQIPVALKASSLIQDDRQRTHFQKWLLLRLGWANPASAMTNASAVEGKIVTADGASDSNLYLQLAVLDNWRQTDLPGAFHWACQLPDAAARQRALETIIAAEPVENFTNTLAQLNDLNPAPAEPVYTRLFERWAAHDPVQAMAQRQQIPGHDADQQLLRAILAVWVAHQPTAAVAWAQTLPEEFGRNQLIADLFNDWAKNDLSAAATACQQLPAGAAREKAWEKILNRWIASDPAAAAALVKDLEPGDYRQEAIAALCQRWAGSDATAALTWASSLPSATEQMTATNQIVANWSKHDPQSAAQFASQHAELSGKVLAAIAAAWAQQDPQGMATYALTLPAGETQTQYLTAACRQLAAQDLPATVGLLQPLTDVALRQTILEQAAGHCDLWLLKPAANFVAALPASDDQKALIQGLLSCWAPADPASALNWLGAFPETNAQPKLVQSVINTWAQHEPAAAAQWLANQPAGTASDDVTNAFLTGVLAKYPAFAAQWTQSISDETRRQKLQLQVARQWLKTDPATATNWMDSLDLPEAIKQSLQKASP